MFWRWRWRRKRKAFAERELFRVPIPLSLGEEETSHEYRYTNKKQGRPSVFYRLYERGVCLCKAGTASLRKHTERLHRGDELCSGDGVNSVQISTGEGVSTGKGHVHRRGVCL